MRSWLILALALFAAAGCAGPGAGEVPAWEAPPAAPAPVTATANAEAVQVAVEAVVVEVRATGLTEPRAGPLSVDHVTRLLAHGAGAQTIPLPSLVTLVGQPASIFVGDRFPTAEAGLKVEVVARADGTAVLDFHLTPLHPEKPPRGVVVPPKAYEAARGMLELSWKDGQPRVLELPGRRLVFEDNFTTEDELRDEPRVYVLLARAWRVP